jgi:hypothetical protein
MWRQDLIDRGAVVVNGLTPADTGNIATPALGTAFDMRNYPGSRFLAVMRGALSITGAVAHGVTFIIEDTTEDTIGSPEAADWATKVEVSAAPAKLTAIGLVAQAFWPSEASLTPTTIRPWVRVKALSDNDATLFSVSAVVIAVPA